MALFSGAKLNIAALSDYAKADKRKLDALRQNKILKSDKLLTVATMLDRDEADIEDAFSPDAYAEILNQAYSLPPANRLTGSTLLAAAPETTRLVKKAEACFRLMPQEVAEFNHYAPAEWLIRNPTFLEASEQAIEDTLANAEKIISAVNGIPL